MAVIICDNCMTASEPVEMLEMQASYNAAIDFTLGLYEKGEADSALVFLGMWNLGEWKEIAKDFPEFDLTTVDELADGGEFNDIRKPCGCHVLESGIESRCDKCRGDE